MTRIIIICAHPPRDAQMTRDIRQWVFESKADPHSRIDTSIAVQKLDDLHSAVAFAENLKEAKPILIFAGERLTTIRQQVPATMLSHTLLAGRRKRREPLATPIASGPAVVATLERKHIEKLALLQAVSSWLTIRRLQTVAEMESFLRLRYEVWTQLGYLSEDRTCPRSRLEVDYSDRYSTAFGAFATVQGSEQLIGGIRLIMEGLDSGGQWKLIEEIMATRNDECLARSAAPRKEHAYPFDLLASFPSFPQTYRDWVRQKLLKAEVSRVIVHPDWRAKGMGEVLVDSAVAHAQEQGLKLLFLACKEEHSFFYERCGFAVMPGLKCSSFSGVNRPAIGMVLNL